MTGRPAADPQPWVDVVTSLGWDAVTFDGADRLTLDTAAGPPGELIFTGDGPIRTTYGPGTRFTLRIAVVTIGAGPGTAAVTIRPPDGWRVSTARTSVPIAGGSGPHVAQLAVEISVPTTATYGDHDLVVVATVADIRADVVDPVRVVTAATPVPLTDAFDHDVVSTDRDRSDGDLGSRFSYPAERLPGPGPVGLVGVDVIMPDGAVPGPNAVRLAGQVVELPPGRHRSIAALGFGTFDLAGATATLEYDDATTVAVELPVSDWSSIQPRHAGDEVAFVCDHIHRPDADTPFPDGVLAAWPRMLIRRSDLDPGRTVRRLRLPDAPEGFLVAITLLS